MGDAAVPGPRSVESEFFRTLNAMVEQVVRAGLGSPGVVPTGLVVLETIGMKTGRRRRVPLVATVLDGCLFVSTARGDRSQWVRNLRAEPRVRYWLHGREHPGTATVFAPGMPRLSSDRLPPLARAIAEGLLPAAAVCGWRFAVITPERAREGAR